MLLQAFFFKFSCRNASKFSKCFTRVLSQVTLNPEELDMDTVAMQAKYDQTVRQQQADIQKEDFSDMVAEHSAKAAKVR